MFIEIYLENKKEFIWKPNWYFKRQMKINRNKLKINSWIYSWFLGCLVSWPLKCLHPCEEASLDWKCFDTQYWYYRPLRFFLGSIQFRPSKPCWLKSHCLKLAAFCTLHYFLNLCKLDWPISLDQQSCFEWSFSSRRLNKKH